MTLAQFVIFFHIHAMKHLLLLCFLFTTAAWADDATTDKGTRISLSASASIEIANDEAVVLYHIEASGSDTNKLRSKVNDISNTIQARLKQEHGLKLTTLGRRMEVLSHYGKSSGRQIRDGWKLVQSEQIVTQRLDVIPDWMNNIEASGALLDGLNYRIATATLENAQQELRLQAIQQFRRQAASLSKAMDASTFHVLEMQTSQNSPVFPMRAEMAMMRSVAADVSAPALNAGEGKISVSVSGTVLLPDKNYSAE